MKKLILASVAGAVLTPVVHAQDTAQQDDTAVQDIIIVESARQKALDAGMLADTIEQTEVIDLSDLVNSQASVLSEALDQTPGARVNNECSMCGVKRIMLNGLGGQHTTMLIDGLPAHTLVSGFYAPDAMSMAGVERIEIARGAGASLTAPEAIGGTVNIVTQDPTRTGGSINFAGGENGYLQGDAVGTFVNKAGTVRGLAAVQYDTRDQFDADDNGVSESPFTENTNYSGRLSFDPTPRSTVTIRAGHVDGEIFGGPMLDEVVGSISETLNGFDGVESDSLFVGDDVRNQYIGAPWETAEWIETTRDELSATYFQEFTDTLNVDLGVSWSDHEQDSFYEGFDYKATNEMLYLTGRLHWALSDAHLLTVGFDRRDEDLSSFSEAAAGDPAYVSDSFDYLTQAVFFQETWTPTDKIEVALAVRVDDIEADFTDPAKPGTEIDETLISPRLDARFKHTDQWTSRFSAGQGYRAPLSFFETDHGILDAGLGFAIEVDELERSNSVTYALSYLGDKLTWTGGLAWTEVDNLAALDETDEGVPLLTQRDDKGSVWGVTFDVGYAITPTLDVSFTAELFDQDDVMRSIFGVAPVEERIVLGADWHPGDWTISGSFSWQGEQDLSDYGYEGWNDVALTSPKTTTGDAYTDLDIRAEYQVLDNIAIYAGGRNLLDNTQVEDTTSPLFYDADGGYDVAYIYGPLRGRELYAGLRFEF